MASALASEIQTLLKDRGKSARWALKEAGLSETFLRDLKNGKSQNPSSRSLIKLATALGVDRFQSLAPEQPDRESSLGERIAAAVHGAWDTRDEALSELAEIGVDEPLLARMTAGEEVPPATLRQFAAVSECPLAWLLHGGSMEGMHWAMNARIALRYPHLARRSLAAMGADDESH